MMNYLKKHWIKTLVIFFVFVFFLGRYEFKMPKRQYADFHVNYYAGQRMLSQQDIYDDNAYRADKMANFKYPPLLATWTILFALTSERVAATWWFILNFFFIILMLSLCGKIIFSKELTNRQKNWIYFWALFLTSRFWMRNFDEGQVNIVMMAVMIGGIYCVAQKRDYCAGFLGGLSLFIKYMGALLIPYFFIKRKWKAIVSLGASVLLFTLFPAIFLGWNRNLVLQQRYIPYVFKTSTDTGSMFDPANQSLISFLKRFFSAASPFDITSIHLSDTSLNVLIILCLGVLFLLCFFPKGKSGAYRHQVEIGMLLICACLFNPNAWLHAFIFLTFGYMVVLAYLFENHFCDKLVATLLATSFIFHSFPQAFFWGRKTGELIEVFSLATLGALVLYGALLAVKLRPHQLKECA